MIKFDVDQRLVVIDDGFKCEEREILLCEEIPYSYILFCI
jgi:hypothetical protein